MAATQATFRGLSDSQAPLTGSNRRLTKLKALDLQMAFLLAFIPEIVEVAAAGIGELFSVGAAGAADAGVEAGVAVAGEGFAEGGGIAAIDGAGDVVGETVGGVVEGTAGEGAAGGGAVDGVETSSVDTVVRGSEANLEDIAEHDSEDLYTSSVVMNTMEADTEVNGHTTTMAGLRQTMQEANRAKLDDIATWLQKTEVSYKYHCIRTPFLRRCCMLTWFSSGSMENGQRRRCLRRWLRSAQLYYGFEIQPVGLPGSTSGLPSRSWRDRWRDRAKGSGGETICLKRVERSRQDVGLRRCCCWHFRNSRLH